MGVDIKKIIEKVINVILDIAIFIFGIILLISIYNNVQTKILKNSYSSFFGYTVFGVQTGSMADEINAGDWIIVKSSKNYKLNDVVTYMENGDFITHRIVETYKNTFITKGDANNAKDSPINREQIVGKVVKILPNFEIFRKTLFNPAVLICLIITLYLAVALFKKSGTELNGKSSISVLDKLKNIGLFDNLFVKYKEVISKLKEKIYEMKSNLDKNKEKLKSEKNIKVNKKNKKIEEIKKVNIDEIKPEEAVVEYEKVEENEDDDVLILPTVDEEDLDKTMCFRVITVNKSEIENAYNKPIVEEEIEEKEEIKEIVKSVEKEEVIKENLELLNKKGKKCKTVIEKCLYIKEQELRKIVEIVLDGEKSKINYATIIDEFIKSYMDGRYYNFCGDVNVEYTNKNKLKRLDLVIEVIKNTLIKKYKGSDNKYSDKVLKFTDIFELINYFENSNDNKLPLKDKRNAYANKIKKQLGFDDLDERKLKSIAEEVIKTQRLYLGMVKYVLDKIDTNLFKINYNSLSKKDMYAIELEHNIAFSKIYSDYIVDKTYSEGLIAEDKMQVLFTLLSSEIVNNMFNCEFNKKYVVYIPETIYSKGNKLDDIFDMFEDEYAKSNIIILFQYSKLAGNKETIKKLIKKGYHFAIDINDTAKFKVSDHEMFEVVDYLFLSKNNPNKESIMLFINKTLHEKVIFDDISNKLGNYMR